MVGYPFWVSCRESSKQEVVVEIHTVPCTRVHARYVHVHVHVSEGSFCV